MIQTAPMQSTGSAILEIRRRSGLTWDELSDLFEVSRRSVHHWASGKVVSAKNDSHVWRVLAVIRLLDKGEAKKTRALLLASQDGKPSAFELLQSGRYEEIAQWAAGVQDVVRTVISRKSSEARRLPSVTTVLSSTGDRPDIPTNSRVAHPRRPKKA
jgi:DNA-binding transcriptional regulator YiaG